MDEENLADSHKEKGNNAFKQGNYQQAIEWFTKAIEEDSSICIYYANRAKCYKLLGQFENALEDSKTSIEIDSSYLKAHLLFGQIMCELAKLESNTSKIEMSINRMKKALTLCTSQNHRVFERDIEKYILRAQKLLYYKSREINQAKKWKSLNLFKKLIFDDDQFKINERQIKYDQLCKFMGNPDKEPDYILPAHFLCSITLELMTDPIVNEFGNSYQKEAYVQEVSQTRQDPKSHKPLKKNIMYPNIA